jgi:antibiotic biosynthesis monooxygenase (ABM) superfamily enzyme|tara:strand:- start:2770 stop:3108 length:339 start_codon:yes stop_codon:yes gene_type:complete
VLSGVRNQGEIEVIARIWKGWTTHDNASAYEDLFKNNVLPKVTQGVDGYISTNLLRRETGDNVEFTTIFWFESLEAVKSFAGPNFEQAVVPEQVKALVSHYEETVHHHDVAL